VIKVFKQFIISILVVYSLVIILFLLNVINTGILIASALSGLINLVNFLASIWAFNRGFKKPNKEFLIYTLGGMGIRLFFVLLLVFISIQFLNIDKYGFIFTLVLMYFISLIIEVNYFRKKVSEKL
jgi:hypothetical protein